jgi:hypothetical protein
MRGIEIPRGDVTKMPVIGTIVTKAMFGFPEVEEQVVAITEEGTMYVLNKWHKPGVPQLRHAEVVKEYRPKVQES